jgi:phospholipid/cholesterol/gamma-HCH transport system substrate-binding protein
MISKAQKIRAGIFFSLTFLLLVGFILFIIGNTLFKKRDDYFIIYKNVSVNGLQLGSAVKYYGITIGRVEDITFKKDNVNDVIVDISIKAGTPIKQDVEASLVGVGITGLKQIEITGGSDEAELLPPGSRIQAGKDAFSDITGKAEIIAEKSELLINRLNDLVNDNNRQKVSRILLSLDSLLANINQLVGDNQTEITAIIANTDTISSVVKNIAANTDIAMARVRELLESEDLDRILENSAAVSDSLKQTKIKQLVNRDIVESIQKLNSALEQASRTFSHIDLTVMKGRDDLFKSLEDLEETLENLREFSRQISEDPSVLIRSRN